MNPDSSNRSNDSPAHVETIEQAATKAVREALRRHMLLGESVAIGDASAAGGVRIIGPEEIRKLLQAA